MMSHFKSLFIIALGVGTTTSPGKNVDLGATADARICTSNRKQYKEVGRWQVEESCDSSEGAG